MILGLTGGLATGKSSAAAELLRLGVRVIDADAIAHFLSLYDPTTLNAIEARFGAAVFTKYGALRRDVLAELAFSSEHQRRELELILHPQISGVIASNVRAARCSGQHLVVMAPLLFEAGLNQSCDKTWVISCTPESQLARLQSRGIDLSHGRLRIEAQMPLSQKKSLADRVIDNDGTLEELQAQVRRAWEGLFENGETEPQ